MEIGVETRSKRCELWSQYRIQMYEKGMMKPYLYKEYTLIYTNENIINKIKIKVCSINFINKNTQLSI